MPPFTPEEINNYARGVVTNEYMMANLNDPDWLISLTLLVNGWENPPENVSTLFLVPFAEHANGRWLNGRVPGCTMTAVAVPVESVQPLLDQIQEFRRLLHPSVAPVPQSGP
jgi:hypothetical protein